MFNLNFNKEKRVSTKNEERNPIKLPEVQLTHLNLTDLSQLLNEGTVIWAWYDMLEKYNVNAVKNFVGNTTDTFAVYQIEYEKYIFKYIACVVDNHFVLKLSEIQYMSDDNLENVINELKDAVKVYYDDQGVTEQTQAFVHDVTVNMIEEALKNKRVMYVFDEHFLEKELSDNISE